MLSIHEETENQRTSFYKGVYDGFQHQTLRLEKPLKLVVAVERAKSHLTTTGPSHPTCLQYQCRYAHAVVSTPLILDCLSHIKTVVLVFKKQSNNNVKARFS